jgi:hypothetical protein
LMAAPMAEVEPPAVHDSTDPDVTTDRRRRALAAAAA